jgi:hypothetical protein
VFDANYGDRLIDLAKGVHVWAVNSGENKLAADRNIRELKDTNPSDEEKKLSLTLARFDDLDTNLVECLEDHHGEYTRHASWNELEVIGRALDARTRKLLEQWGFKSFKQTLDGFLAKK